MKKTISLVGLVLIFSFSSSYAGKDVELSWEKAPVYIPGKLF